MKIMLIYIFNVTIQNDSIVLQEDLRSQYGKTYRSQFNVISFHVFPESFNMDVSKIKRDEVIPGTTFCQPR